MLNLVSTFRKFQLVTEGTEQGTFISYKIGKKYKIQLKIYWNEMEAKRGHKQYEDFYSKKNEWSNYIKDVAVFK